MEKRFNTVKFLKWCMDSGFLEETVKTMAHIELEGNTPYWAILCNGMTEEEMLEEGYGTSRDWMI